jgi:hypothetical protein
MYMRDQISRTAPRTGQEVEMKIKKINGSYALTGAPRENHRRGKNYAAIVKGLSDEYGLSREFLNWSRELGIYIFPTKPEAGEFIEVVADYYTGSGNRIRSGSWGDTEFEDSGFFVVQPDGSLVPISRKKVVDSFTSTEDVSL